MKRIFEYFTTLWKITNKKGPKGRPIKARGFPLFLWFLDIVLLLVVIGTWFDLWVFIGFLVMTIIAYYVGLLTIKSEKQ